MRRLTSEVFSSETVAFIIEELKEKLVKYFKAFQIIAHVLDTR